MKKVRILITIFLLLIFYCYFINISNFPDKILLYNDSKLDLRLCPLLNMGGETQVSTSENISEYNLNLSLASINLKNVEVKVAKKLKVIPGGNLIGLKLYTDGVVIVGFSDIVDIAGKKINLGDTTDLKTSDRIIEVNGKEINTISELKNEITKNQGRELKLKIEKTDGEQKEIKINPIHTGNNEYKLGLWVKDAATGVGTLSFYIPSTKEFVALGHGIVDADTNSILQIDFGEITTTDIVSITKGNARKSRRSKRYS